MSKERRRAVLEELAYGDATTPGERLRALELLRELDGSAVPGRDFREEVASLSDDELEDALKAFCAPLEHEIDAMWAKAFEQRLAKRERLVCARGAAPKRTERAAPDDARRLGGMSP
jgi:hypothetical protein